MKNLMLFFFVTLSQAQILKVTAPTYASPGTIVTARIAITGSTGNIVALEDTITVTPTPTSTSVIADTTVNNKSNVCIISSGSTCVLLGVVPAPVLNAGLYVIAPTAVFNDTAIPDGTIVQDVSITVPATAVVGTNYTITVANTWAADVTGSNVTIAGSSVTINVQTTLTLTQTAYNTWAASPTQANFLALVSAEIAAQQAGGK